MLHGRGQNQKRPTNGRFRYITLAVLGVPNALEQETKSELAHITRSVYATSGRIGYITHAV